MTSAALPPVLRRVTGPVWLWPVLAMLGVGLYRLWTPELWRDEVATWAVATRSPGELWAMLQNVDASNGAYYLFMHGWTAVFGDSTVALRLPSVLAMAGAAGFVALAAKQLFGGRVAGVAAGLLFAVVPTIARFAQEARSYALVVCAVAAASWLLLRALERPARGWAAVGRWAPYSVAMAAAGIGHLISFSTLVGQVGVVLLHLWRTRSTAEWRLLLQYPAAVVLGALPAVPVVVLGSRQSGRQLGWIMEPTFQQLRKFGDLLFGSTELYHVFVALAALALGLPGRRVAALQPLLLAVAPVVTVWAVSQGGGTSYFTERYLLFTVPAWAVVAGGGVAAVHRVIAGTAERSRTPGQVRAAVAVLAAGLVAVPALSAAPVQQKVRHVGSHSDSQEPYRAAAALIAAGYRPGDGLAAPIGNQNWAMVAEGVAYYLPEDVRPQQLLVERSAVEADDLFPVPCARPAECIGGPAPRIWLLVLGDTPDPLGSMPVEPARTALQNRYTASQVSPLGGVTLALLSPKSG
ncbi:glycosyltransferase family 39 protein [Kitasatospora sp. NPDC054939]